MVSSLLFFAILFCHTVENILMETLLGSSDFGPLSFLGRSLAVAECGNQDADWYTNTKPDDDACGAFISD